MKEKNIYWKEYWNNICFSNDEQKNVGRTKNGVSIPVRIWENTVEYIFQLMSISPNDNVLDLCCGNGLITLPLCQIARQITAIDFSDRLINNLLEKEKQQNIKNLTAFHGDILDQNTIWPEKVHKIFLYFALQHFTEKQVLSIMERSYKVLQEGGKILLGDIPDLNCIWNFANTETYEREFFSQLKDNKASIGTWFDPMFLSKMAHFVGFDKVYIARQPSWQYNSHYRFDMILEK